VPDEPENSAPDEDAPEDDTPEDGPELEKLNGELVRELRLLNRQLERFNRKRRYVLLSLTGGMARGFGAALGATLIFAVALALLTRLDSVPVVGEYVTNVIQFVKQNSPASMLLPDKSPTQTPTPSAVDTPTPESN